MQENSDVEGFSDQQRNGLDARRADHDRTLEAIHRLEAALARAAPGREEPWRDEVLEALSVLEATTAEEADNARRPDSLLSDLSHTQPLLRNRARTLRLQYAKLRDTIASLLQELGESEHSGVDYADLRQRLGWLLTSLRHQRARESDLIYEAYYDAFKVDLRTAGEKGTP